MVNRAVAMTLLLAASLVLTGDRALAERQPVSSGGATAAPHTVADAARWRFLDQHWDAATRERFWFTSQGSRLIPYRWFLALEQADELKTFRSDAHMEALRFIPAPRTARNPDALPVGFVKDEGDGDWAGLTCAACHTAQIDYKGTSLIIDGGPAMGNIDRLFVELAAALRMTAADPAKLRRFADKVIGAGQPQGERDQLLRRVREESARLDARWKANTANPPAGISKDYPGYARIDAYGQIYNQVTALDLGVPENAKFPNAPASYPYLWGTPQSDVVQWNGAGQNRFPNENFPIGVLVRNAIEAMGVFGRTDMSAGLGVYPSSVDLANLGRLEQPLCRLHAPKWPSDVFGAPDANLVAEGKQVYDAHCITCHARVDDEQKYEVEGKLKPIEEVQTDPNLAVNAAQREVLTGRLDKRPKRPGGEPFGPKAYAHEVLAHAVGGVVLAKLLPAFDGIAWSACATPPDKMTDVERVQQVQDALAELLPKLDVMPLKYKPRPLNGIWATAPYLHNGSIPSLAELLKAPADRVKKFYVGTREFDPVLVGFRTDPGPDTTEFDTSLDGNHNTGHGWVADLTDQQRRQLLEYLKTL